MNAFSVWIWRVNLAVLRGIVLLVPLLALVDILFGKIEKTKGKYYHWRKPS